MPSRDLATIRQRRAWAIALTIIAIAVHAYAWKLASPHRDVEGRASRDYSAIRFDDERNYYVHCANRVAEEGILYLAEEDSLRSPPLPWLWLLLFGRNIALTRAANILAIIAASWLIASIVRDRWGERLALVAFALCALGYQVVSFSATVLTEPLAFVWVCAALWAAHRAESHDRVGYVVLTGVLTAVATFARPSLQLWPLAVILGYGVVRRIRRRKANDVFPTWTWRRVALLVAVHCAVLSPWMIKNAICFGTPRIANGFGAVFYLGSEFRTDGDEPIFSGMNWPNTAIQGPGGHMSLDGEKRLSAAALENIREHPVQWAALCCRKIGRTLIGGPKWHFYPSATLRGKSHFEGETETLVVYLWWTCLGTIVTIAGLFGLSARQREGGFLFLFGLMLVMYMSLLHGATFALPRFAVPLWPVFVIGAVAILARRPRPLGVGALAIVCVSIVAYLTMYHVRRPACEVDADRSSHFSIIAERTAADVRILDLPLDPDGWQPEYNTCIFVTSRLSANSGDSRVHATLHLTPSGAQGPLEEQYAIGFPMIADGAEHTYMLCTELNSAWRDRKWGAVRMEIDSDAMRQANSLTLRIGH